jgi:ribosomal protein L37E
MPLLLGLACTGLGLWFLADGWAAASAGGDPAAAAPSFAAGALLLVLGPVMAIAPLLAPALYRIYGAEAFASRGGACPVVAKCARCGEFTFRGKEACKACGAPLVAQTS